MDNVETQETVDVTTLDDAALAQQIAETPDAPSEKVSIEPPASEKKDEAVITPASEKKDEPTLPVTTPPADEQVTVSKAEWEKMQKQVGEKEKFIGRQSSEIGMLRQKAQENLERIKQELSNGSIDMNADPLGAANKVVEYNNAKTEETRLEKEHYTAWVQEQVSRQLPKFEELLPDMVEILKADGYDSEVIKDFARSPYEDNPVILINLARRAEAMKTERTLRAEVEELKKKPQAVVKGIEAAMKESRPMTASSGAASSVKPEVSTDQIPLMSDAELEDTLKNSK